MHKVTLLCVGKLSSGWIAEGCNGYIKRLGHSVRVDVREIAASKEKNPGRQRNDESARLFSAMAKHPGGSIVLDERGERMTSVEFARFLQKAFDAGAPLTFIIGGAYGLSDEVRKAAKKAIRLSDMTLPHELCRILFLEQLYRAVEIIKGSGYHH